MTSSVSDDLTSRRIASKWRVFFAELEKVYEMRSSPKPDFWPTYDAEEAVLVEKLKRRPIGTLELDNLFATFRSKILKAL
jgi:hypothetical protein